MLKCYFIDSLLKVSHAIIQLIILLADDITFPIFTKENLLMKTGEVVDDEHLI